MIKIPKIKDKERTLKATREVQLVTYRGVLISLSADFSKETAGLRGLARNIQSHEKHRPTAETAIPSKVI